MEIKREVIMDVLQAKTVEEIADYFKISKEKASELKAHNERNYWESSIFINIIVAPNIASVS